MSSDRRPTLGNLVRRCYRQAAELTHAALTAQAGVSDRGIIDLERLGNGRVLRRPDAVAATHRTLYAEGATVRRTQWGTADRGQDIGVKG
jgi:hypothetical protein